MLCPRGHRRTPELPPSGWSREQGGEVTPMATVKITANFRGVIHELETFEAEIGKGGARALNTTIKAAQALAVDRLAQEAGLDIALVRKSTGIDLASSDRLN